MQFLGAPHYDRSWIKKLAHEKGTISALFGLSHKIIDEIQYSTLVAAIIGTAIIPTVIANSLSLPRHLLPESESTPSAPAAAQPKQAALQD